MRTVRSSPLFRSYLGRAAEVDRDWSQRALFFLKKFGVNRAVTVRERSGTAATHVSPGLLEPKCARPARTEPRPQGSGCAAPDPSSRRNPVQQAGHCYENPLISAHFRSLRPPLGPAHRGAGPQTCRVGPHTDHSGSPARGRPAAAHRPPKSPKSSHFAPFRSISSHRGRCGAPRRKRAKLGMPTKLHPPIGISDHGFSGSRRLLCWRLR